MLETPRDTGIPIRYANTKKGTKAFIGDLTEDDRANTYTCIDCHQELELVLNTKKRQKHFRHSKVSNPLLCANVSREALLKAFIQTLLSEKRIEISQVLKANPNDPKDKRLVSERYTFLIEKLRANPCIYKDQNEKLHFEQEGSDTPNSWVKLEARPDVVIWDKDGYYIALVITFKGKMKDYDKDSYILDEIESLEIKTPRGPNKENLVRRLLNHTSNQTWIYNDKAEKAIFASLPCRSGTVFEDAEDNDETTDAEKAISCHDRAIRKTRKEARKVKSGIEYGTFIRKYRDLEREYSEIKAEIESLEGECEDIKNNIRDSKRKFEESSRERDLLRGEIREIDTTPKWDSKKNREYEDLERRYTIAKREYEDARNGEFPNKRELGKSERNGGVVEGSYEDIERSLKETEIRIINIRAEIESFANQKQKELNF